MSSSISTTSGRQCPSCKIDSYIASLLATTICHLRSSGFDVVCKTYRDKQQSIVYVFHGPNNTILETSTLCSYRQVQMTSSQHHCLAVAFYCLRQQTAQLRMWPAGFWQVLNLVAARSTRGDALFHALIAGIIVSGAAFAGSAGDRLWLSNNQGVRDHAPPCQLPRRTLSLGGSVNARDGISALHSDM